MSRTRLTTAVAAQPEELLALLGGRLARSAPDAAAVLEQRPERAGGREEERVEDGEEARAQLRQLGDEVAHPLHVAEVWVDREHRGRLADVRMDPHRSRQVLLGLLRLQPGPVRERVDTRPLGELVERTGRPRTRSRASCSSGRSGARSAGSRRRRGSGRRRGARRRTCRGGRGSDPRRRGDRGRCRTGRAARRSPPARARRALRPPSGCRRRSRAARGRRGPRSSRRGRSPCGRRRRGTRAPRDSSFRA